MENEKFYNIVKGFVSILNIYRNISLPGNGRKMRIWDSRRELGQTILKKKFFSLFRHVCTSIDAEFEGESIDV
jgi:hypothetical protein